MSALYVAIAWSDRRWIALDGSPAMINDTYTYLTKLLRFRDSWVDGSWGGLPAALADLSHYGRPPLYQLAALPFVGLLGRSEDAATAVNLVFLAVFMTTVFLVGRHLSGPWAGLVAVVVSTSYPPVLQMSRSFMPYAALPACTALMLGALIWTVETRRPRAAWAWGATLCLGALMHPNFVWAVVPVALLYGLHLWLFCESPRAPGETGPSPAWPRGKLRDPFFLLGLLPAAAIALLPTGLWFALAGHRIRREIGRVFVGSSGKALRGFDVQSIGFEKIEPTFWWYAKTAPHTISALLLAFLLLGVIAACVRPRRSTSVVLVYFASAFVVFGVYPIRAWWYFTIAAPAAGLLTAHGIACLRPARLRAGLAALLTLTAVFVHAFVSWGLPAKMEPWARILGAPLDQTVCLSRVTGALCPFPPKSDPWPLDEVARSLLDTEACRERPCEVAALQVVRPNRLEALAAVDGGGQIEVANVGSRSYGTTYALDRLLRSDFLLFCNRLVSRRSRELALRYEAATVELLQFPPGSIAESYRDLLHTEVPACGDLRLWQRTRAPSLEEAEDIVALLRIDPRAKSGGLAYLARRYLEAALREPTGTAPMSWDLGEIATAFGEGRLSPFQASLYLRFHAVRRRLEGREDRAVAAYQRAIGIAPSSESEMRHRSLLAGYYRDRGRDDLAEKLYLRNLESCPTRVDDRVRIAELQIDARRYTAAIETLEQALKRAPDDAGLQRLLRRARNRQRLEARSRRGDVPTQASAM